MSLCRLLPGLHQPEAIPLSPVIGLPDRERLARFRGAVAVQKHHPVEACSACRIHLARRSFEVGRRFPVGAAGNCGLETECNERKSIKQDNLAVRPKFLAVDMH